MVVVTGALLLLAVVATFADWRRGLFVAVPVAVLQDPLRKLTPDEPAAYVLLVGVVFGAAALVAVSSGVSLMPRSIWGWRRYLTRPFGLFIAIVLLQAINALTNFGNVFLPLIGMLAYLTPFVALCFVYQAVVRSPDNFLIDFFRFYVACTFLALITLYPQYLGYDWSILGEVGQGLIIYDRDAGTILSAYSGVFRSSEVAAWHAATSVCFLTICIISRRMTLSKVVAATIFVLLIISLGMLTGRRKFLVEIIAFASAYATLLFYFRRGATKIVFVTGLIGLMGYLAFALWMPDGLSELAARRVPSDAYAHYVARTQNVFKDIPDRVNELGVAPIGWAYNRYGLLGAGLGTGSQGSQYFGAMVQGAAEGGLGKIWLELGAPGLIVIVWLGWAFTRYIWTILKLVNSQSVPLGRVSCGLASFLVANVATFAVATQVYGDIFVLLLLGTALGALLAMPILAQRALQRRALSLTPNASSVLLTQLRAPASASKT